MADLRPTMPTESYTPDPAGDLELLAEASKSPEDFRLVYRVLMAAYDSSCRVGHMTRFADEVASLAVAALATDGRLLPPETEVRTEWGVWWHSGDSDGIVLSADRISFREHAERRGEERIGDYGITRYTLRTREHRSFVDGSTLVGPWLPVPDQRGTS